jgi:hypothetical protein
MRDTQSQDFCYHCRMARPKIMSDRKLVSFPPDLARAVEDYRFSQRIASESEAIRRLIEAGLATQVPTKFAKAKRQT